MIESLLATPAASQLFGGIGKGLGQGLGDAIGGGSAPMTSGSGVFDLRSAMDGSGWTVSTGKSSATSDYRRQQSSDSAAAPLAGVSQAGMGTNGLMLAVLLGLFVAFVKRGKL